MNKRRRFLAKRRRSDAHRWAMFFKRVADRVARLPPEERLNFFAIKETPLLEWLRGPSDALSDASAD